MPNLPSPRELLGQAFGALRRTTAEELAELDSELARMDVRDVAGRLRSLRDELEKAA
jgi:hypothetical protein